MNEDRILAAVDLGSNSFHLLVARVEGGQIFPLDTLREPVRLGAGIGADKHIDAATCERTLDCLARFGQRLRGMPVDNVRVVGTNAFRVAKNIGELLPEAEVALGFPIEIVAGREEARLIYLGVAHSLPASRQRRLVVDIGGGSTECIVGQFYRPLRLDSLYMGCVSYTLRFFPDGRITADSLRRAQIAALSELEHIAHDFRPPAWTQAVGSSGSARALSQIIGEEQGLDSGVITPDGLERLAQRLQRAGRVDPSAFPQVRPDRVQVLPGGLAIMRAVFEALGIERMVVAEGAMRQGILYDMLGRSSEKDLRGATVHQFQRRYRIDLQQASAVETTALQLFEQMQPDADESARQQLRWAADLHELGLSVACAGYHKHSAYILRNADMPGFSRAEQDTLATLVLGHRGKLARVSEVLRQPLRCAQVAALRLSALLHRSRHLVGEVPIQAYMQGDRIRITLDAAWLEAHPLTLAALHEELRQWESLGLRLQLA